MEQIYTIPVNEAFEAGASNPSCGCPFCRLRDRLEAEERDLILGASMMEPETRQKTNAQGFCRRHFKMLLDGGKKLPVALILESHLAEIDDMIKKPGIMPGLSGGECGKRIRELCDDCYICRRVGFNFDNMMSTAALLWESDPDFRKKCDAQPWFCLEHFGQFVLTAKDRLKTKDFSEFYRAMYKKESETLEKLSKDVSWFAKKFDYRYADEPWNGAENAVERAVEFLCPGTTGEQAVL